MAKLKEGNIFSWIHCNSCYLYYDESDRFNLVNCMHIFCNECLQSRVISNGVKCCFCKKSVKFKKIDRTLDAKLLAALAPDPTKDFNDLTRCLGLNARQTANLHEGIQKAHKHEKEYEQMGRTLDEEEAKLKALTEKIVAQNSVIGNMIVGEEEKAQGSLNETSTSQATRSEIISSSQNLMRQSGGRGEWAKAPPHANPRSSGFGGHKQRPNVTRLSSISTGRSFI